MITTMWPERHEVFAQCVSVAFVIRVADRGSQMRSILLHVEDDPSLEARVQTALSLARTTSGHVTCLHITPIEAYVAFDSFGGVFVMEKVLEALTDQEDALHARVEAAFRKEDVSWDYRKSTGSVVQVLLSYGALADVIVTGRVHRGGKSERAALGQLGDVIMKSRVPVLITPDAGAVFDPSGKAVIGWNDSYEAANAVRSALPLLKYASNVEVISVEEPAEKNAALFPSTRLLEYLSRHDINAELTVEKEVDFVSETLLAAALDGGASYLVLGGFGHSRIREYVFGGVTRAMLESSPVNLVIAH
jgi:nucleotide-binding universal stress UspA family protein